MLYLFKNRLKDCVNDLCEGFKNMKNNYILKFK